MRTTWDDSPLKGRASPSSSERMVQSNPMRDAKVRKKVSEAHKAAGHRPERQGGNGRPLSLPQQALADLTDYIPEYVVPTRLVRHLVPGLPNHYKIDLAHPGKMIAVEVDGSSHRTLLGRERDDRKNAALAALGWTVIRFRNEEVMNDPQKVARQILMLNS